MVHLSSDSLRHYEKMNLISPKRKENNYRIYTEVEYRQVQYIKVLQYLGFSLKEVGQLLKLDKLEISGECHVLTDDFFIKKTKQLEDIVSDYVYILDELKIFMNKRESLFQSDFSSIKDFTDTIVDKIFNRLIDRST